MRLMKQKYDFLPLPENDFFSFLTKIFIPDFFNTGVHRTDKDDKESNNFINFESFYASKQDE